MNHDVGKKRICPILKGLNKGVRDHRVLAFLSANSSVQRIITNFRTQTVPFNIPNKLPTNSLVVASAAADDL